MRETLKAIPLFRDLSNDDLDFIASRLKYVSLQKGETIFRQGDPGDAMYLVENGQVVVWDDKIDEAIAYLGKGSFVGEIALLLPEPRTAGLKVALDADLYKLEKHAFDELLKERPAIAVYMTRELSRRLLNTTQKRNQTRTRRISALWGDDYAELIRTIDTHIDKSIAIIPLEGCTPPDQVIDDGAVMVLDSTEISNETIASVLGLQVDVHGHIVMLLPKTDSALARHAMKLADIVISIGIPPAWISTQVESSKLWATSNQPKHLNRIARRITGHTVGLALSSGGGKGLAHLGVMKVLQDEGIPIDMIAGTSAGAFFGILSALGWDSSRLGQFADDIQTFNTFRNWDINMPPKAGILKGAKARDIIAGMVENKQFEDLDVPFYCVAADVLTGDEVVFESGDLADAIRASLSIPGIANPWKIDNRYLIDGAFVDPIPAELLRKKGADIVIASSVIQPLADASRNGSGSIEPATKMPHFLKIITNIQSIVEEQLVESQLDAIDVMIHTKAKVSHALDFDRAHEIVAAGEETAKAHLPAIRACLEAAPGT